MTNSAWIDKEAPRKLGTVVATVSVVIPSLLLSFSAILLQSDFFNDLINRKLILGFISAVCLLGTIASARTVDWLMDSIKPEEWQIFLVGRADDVSNNMLVADEFVFRLKAFQGGYFLLAIMYSCFCVLFSSLIVICFVGEEILNRVEVLGPTFIIASSVFYQMMTNKSRFGSFVIIIGVCTLVWGLIVMSP